MAGGTFIGQNKERPGAYINVKTIGNKNTAEAVEGVMTLPLALDFGPEKQVTEVTVNTDFTSFGYDLSHEKMLLLREAFKAVQTVLVYRVGGGGKATETNGDFAATALYGGTRGNDISIVSKANVNTPNTFDVETYLDGRLIDTQNVTTIESLQKNQVVEFSGNGNLTAFSLRLSGGSNMTATVQDYSDYFDKVQVYNFNTMALPVDTEAIKVAGASFIKRMREEEGKKCQLVVAGYSADSEAVINVKNGVLLPDFTLNAAQTTVWVAAEGASAGADRSLTGKAYPDAVDVVPRYTNKEIVECLKKGEFVFTEQRGRAVVEQDINSLTTFTTDKNYDLSKNTVLRTLDAIANFFLVLWEDNYKGTLRNTAANRDAFKVDGANYLNGLQASSAIEEFDSELDLTVGMGDSKENVVAELYVKPTDAMEKLYLAVFSE